VGKSVRKKIDTGAYRIVCKPFSVFMVALAGGKWAIYDDWCPDKLMYRTYSTAGGAEEAGRAYVEDPSTREVWRDEGVVLL
jgi:hypothetical protein